MENSSQLSIFIKIAFVFLTGFLAFFLGTFYGAWVTPKGSGLAGPVIVLGYGVVAFVLGLLIGWAGIKKLSVLTIKRLTKIFVVFALCIGVWLTYRWTQVREKIPNSSPSVKERPIAE